MGGVHRTGRRRYYRCYGSKRSGLKCRPKPYIDADELEELIWAEVAESLKDPDSFYQVLDTDDGGDSPDGGH